MTPALGEAFKVGNRKFGDPQKYGQKMYPKIKQVLHYRNLWQSPLTNTECFLVKKSDRVAFYCYSKVPCFEGQNKLLGTHKEIWIIF